MIRLRKMNHKERTVFIISERKKRDNIMDISNKGGEYCRSNKANANFYRVAEYLGITAEEACIIYMLKHLDSIVNYVRGSNVQSEPIDGRCHDLANYAEILHCIIKERELK